jgi:hypothetical protein
MAEVKKILVGLRPYLMELFYTTTGALVIFVAMEICWPGIVLAYLNPNLVLTVWLSVGTILLLINNSREGNNFNSENEGKPD